MSREQRFVSGSGASLRDARGQTDKRTEGQRRLGSRGTISQKFNIMSPECQQNFTRNPPEYLLGAP